jgi:replicative DNA helicase
VGKTAFALNIAQQSAVKEGSVVMIFDLEMSKEQLASRILSTEALIESSSLRNGMIKSDEWVRLATSAAYLSTFPLLIDDTASMTVQQMKAKLRRVKDLGLVIIDYLQLMNGNGKSDSRQQEISEISRALKLMAKELQIPVIALSQLSRQVESRPDHRPMLSDLRESGAIEQDADVVLFIYRDEVYNKDTEKKDQAEIIIAKQRSGPIGTVELAWLPQYTQFANLAR